MPISVSVITPEKVALTDEVDSIVAPAEDGRLGILPGHTPLLTKLGLGEITLKKGEELTYFMITGGFLEVHEGNRVEIFAETAEPTDEIDLEQARIEAEREKERAQAHNLTPEELAKAEASMARTVARVKIAQTRKTRKPPIGEK